MKKIYLSILGLASVGYMSAQNAVQTSRKPAPGQIVAYPHTKGTNGAVSKPANGPGHLFRGIFAENIIDIKGFTQGSEFNVYAQPIFMDSTVVSSSSDGLSHVFNMKAGANFDPTSFFWNGGSQLLSSGDSYTVDSLWIGGAYTKVNNAATDTLIVEYAWGLPSNTNVYQSLSIGSQTPALVFRTPKLSSGAAHGDVSNLTAPATNYRKIKRVLLPADTVKSANDGYIIIPNVNQVVPAGNIFSVVYTYKPGSVVPAGSIIKQYTGGAAQNQNGMISFLYSDPSTTSNYNFYDNNSFSTGLDFYNTQRYATYTGAQAFLNNCAFPMTEGGWDVGFSVSWSSSSVGIKEESSKGFALGQNAPNPFSNGSTVKYELTKNANAAIFTVTDVMGRVISTQNVDATKGSHTVNLGSYASGVYYYSLNVDGNVTTKKMIAQ